MDKLKGPGRPVRLTKDVPFAIHFHMPPGTDCQRGDGTGKATIRSRDGKRWTFSAEGAAMSIEESSYLADTSGLKHRLQIVLRGATFGDSEINWLLEAHA